MTGICYNSPTCYANLGVDNWTSDNPGVPVNGVNAALLTSSYTPQVNVDAKWADISGSECSATGYSAGGEAVTLSGTIATNIGDVLAGTSPSWVITAGTLAPRYVAYYINATISTIQYPLIAYQDLGQSYSVTNTHTFTVRENDGVVTLT
jgi:hypothetical protein